MRILPRQGQALFQEIKHYVEEEEQLNGFFAPREGGSRCNGASIAVEYQPAGPALAAMAAAAAVVSGAAAPGLER